MLVDLGGPVAGLRREVVLDEASADQLGQQVAEGGAQRRAEADQREGDREVVQEAAEDRQEQRAGNGEGLQAGKGKERRMVS